jgi:hypothetical protein
MPEAYFIGHPSGLSRLAWGSAPESPATDVGDAGPGGAP